MSSPITIVFVLGPPGAGKGTLCKRIAAETDWCHISIGDCLRQLSNSNTQRFAGLTLRDMQAWLQSRALLPPEVTTAVIAHMIGLEQQREGGKRHFLIDGYPRTVPAAVLFELDIGKPAMVVLFECPKDVAGSRFVNRQREDDDDAGMFERRYGEFERLNPEIWERYAEVGKKVSSHVESEALMQILTWTARHKCRRFGCV